MLRVRLKALVVLFTLWRRLPPHTRRLLLGLARRHGRATLLFLWAFARQRAARRR
jgi:hypothetical protein